MCFHVRSKLQMMRRPTTTQASPKINLHLVTEILIVLPNSIFVYLIKTLGFNRQDFLIFPITHDSSLRLIS